MHILKQAVLFGWLMASVCLQATDCKTNCSKHFSKPWQVLDLSRCETEREIACRYGITNCDTFKVPVLKKGYDAVRFTIQEMNEETGWPKDPGECHQAVGYLSMAHSASGAKESAANAWRFFQKLFDAASDTADTASNNGLWVMAAKEGIKAVLNCGCKEASYRYRHSATAPTPPGDDYFVVSMVNDDGYSMYRGPNTADNRASLVAKAKQGLKGASERTITSTVSLSKRTLTEVICKEGSTWRAAAGKESIEGMMDKVKQLGWSGCLFRMSNFSAKEPFVKDRYFVSVTNGPSWGLKTGSSDDKQAVLEDAIRNAGGAHDSKESGFFSTFRPTRTRVICEDKNEVVGDVEIGGGSIMLFGGVGYQSVKRAIDGAQKQVGSKCKFEVSDADFGPTEKLMGPRS